MGRKIPEATSLADQKDIHARTLIGPCVDGATSKCRSCGATLKTALDARLHSCDIKATARRRDPRHWGGLPWD